MGQHERAQALFEEALALNREQGDKDGLAFVLEGFAALAAARGDAGRALRLAGAAAALRESIDSTLPPLEQEALERRLAAARRAFGDGEAGRLLGEGRATPLERAVAYAIEGLS
jgi:hypothetical protein